MFWWFQDSDSTAGGMYHNCHMTAEAVCLHTTLAILQISVAQNMEEFLPSFEYIWAIIFHLSHTLLSCCALKSKHLVVNYFNLCLKNSTNSSYPSLRRSLPGYCLSSEWHGNFNHSIQQLLCSCPNSRSEDTLLVLPEEPVTVLLCVFHSVCCGRKAVSWKYPVPKHFFILSFLSHMFAHIYLILLEEQLVQQWDLQKACC